MIGYSKVSAAGRGRTVIALIAIGIIGANPAFSAEPIPAPAESWRYADFADLFGAAPIVARVRVASAVALKGASPAPGTTRFYIESDVVTLIRGPQNLAPHFRYLADVATDSRGRTPRIRKVEFLIAALPVPGRPGEIRLAAPDAQQPWSAAIEARARAAAAEQLAPGALPRVTGIGQAFHVAGSIPGEGETQIFLTTATGAPVSLSILRRPGEAPRWSLAQGEIVDESARAPAVGTLPWYRLACFLPRSLPDASLGELAAADADAARADYALVIAALGECGRVRKS